MKIRHLYLLGGGVNMIILFLTHFYFVLVNKTLTESYLLVYGYFLLTLLALLLYLPYFLLNNIKILFSKVFRLIVLFLPTTVFFLIGIFNAYEAIEAMLVMLPYYGFNFIYGLYVEKILRKRITQIDNIEAATAAKSKEVA